MTVAKVVAAARLTTRSSAWLASGSAWTLFWWADRRLDGWLQNNLFYGRLQNMGWESTGASEWAAHWSGRAWSVRCI